MAHEKPIWNFSKPADFKEQVMALPTDLRKVLGNKMNDLAYSEFPNRLGERKISKKYGEVFTIDIDNSYRLAFLVIYATKTIQIIRLGDHKEVYGKD